MQRQSFEELVASRRAWITEVLEPWCRQALRADLLKAEAEWGDIAGRVDELATLWTWAWSRFPALVQRGVRGIDETRPVRVELHDGRRYVGYPDARASVKGRLVLLAARGDAPGFEESGPFSIDDIARVEPIEELNE
jgi:hypothetical protein